MKFYAFLIVSLLTTVPLLAVHTVNHKALTVKERISLTEDALGRKMKLHERLVFRTAVKSYERKVAKGAKQERKQYGLAIAGVILGALAITGALAIISGGSLGWLIFSALPGLIVSIVGLVKANKFPEDFGGKTMSIVGIVVNSVVIVGFIAAIIVAIRTYN